MLWNLHNNINKFMLFPAAPIPCNSLTPAKKVGRRDHLFFNPFSSLGRPSAPVLPAPGGDPDTI